MKSHRMNPVGLIGTIACKEHKVGFNAKGQLALLDHSPDSLRKEAALEILENKPSACRELRSNWKKSFNETLDWNRLFPPTLIEFRKDCQTERGRRIDRRCKELQVESWNPLIPIYRRCSFLEKLLNRLLSTRLQLPQRQWLSLKYEHTGWFPLTLHYPYPDAASQRACSMGVKRTYVQYIYERGLATQQGGLTLYLPEAFAVTREAVQLVPVDHKGSGLCLQKRRVILRDCQG